MTVHYLDSSSILYLILENNYPEGSDNHRNTSIRSNAMLKFLQLNHNTDIISSTLLRTEVSRVLRREAVDPSEANETLSRIEILPNLLSDITDAGNLSVRYLKTLDAIHLATAIRLGANCLVTYDAGLIKASTQLGITVRSPGLPE